MNVLAKKYRETMNAAKMAYVKFCMQSGVLSDMDGNTAMEFAELAQITNQLLNLSCEMIDQQQDMMEKFDKCMDKYLET